MRIYTGGGDRGRTSLFSGERVAKDHPRVEAVGDLDELNSILGLLRAGLPPDRPDLADEVGRIQSDLFRVGTILAVTPDASTGPAVNPVTSKDAVRLEEAIDRLDKTLPDLTAFVLPGGCQAAAMAHLARAVCRRAERRAVSLASSLPDAADGSLEPVLVYLNRLSDYLFVLARYCNQLQGVPDTPWET